MLQEFNLTEKINIITGIAMVIITFAAGSFILIRFIYSDMPNTNWMFFSFIILLYALYRSYKVFILYKSVKEKKLYENDN